MNIKIIGAGLTGATVARLLADKGHEIEVYERRSRIGGNCYDYMMGKAFISVYGPHIFHTNDKEVWDFVNRFTDINDYKHEVLAYSNYNYYHWPINLKTMRAVFGNISIDELKAIIFNESKHIDKPKNFEEKAISLVGSTLYKKFIEGYTKKMWRTYPRFLSADLCKRIPLKWTNDNYFFSDKYQGLPEYGYTNMINEMLNHKNIRIYTNFEMNLDNYLSFGVNSDLVVSTANLNIFDSNIKYCTMSFLRMVDSDICGPVVNYSDSEQIIRKTNYAEMWNERSFKMTVVEIPGEYDSFSDDLIPMALGVEAYPIPNKDLEDRAQRMVETLKKEGIHSIGRLGRYKYLNMDQAIRDAMDFVEGVL